MLDDNQILETATFLDETYEWKYQESIDVSGIAITARQLDDAMGGLLDMHKRQQEVDSAEDDQVDIELSYMYLEDMNSARSNVERAISQQIILTLHRMCTSDVSSLDDEQYDDHDFE